MNKRVPEAPDALQDVNVTPLKVFLRLFDTNGVTQVPLGDLVSTVYPSYKLEFLAELIAQYPKKRKMKRGERPPKMIDVSPELVYFRTPKPLLCPGVTSEVLVNFFVPFFAQDDKRPLGINSRQWSRK
jgi:hypothetical protein